VSYLADLAIHFLLMSVKGHSQTSLRVYLKFHDNIPQTSQFSYCTIFSTHARLIENMTAILTTLFAGYHSHQTFTGSKSILRSHRGMHRGIPSKATPIESLFGPCLQCVCQLLKKSRLFLLVSTGRSAVAEKARHAPVQSLVSGYRISSNRSPGFNLNI